VPSTAGTFVLYSRSPFRNLCPLYRFVRRFHSRVACIPINGFAQTHARAAAEVAFPRSPATCDRFRSDILRGLGEHPLIAISHGRTVGLSSCVLCDAGCVRPGSAWLAQGILTALRSEFECYGLCNSDTRDTK